MGFINNDPEQIVIRRSQNTLIVVGTGTVLFSIWTAVKMIGRLFMLREETVAAMRSLIGDDAAQYSDKEVFVITLLITLFFTLFLLAVRAYIGLSALAEGRGLKRRRFYVPLAVTMIVLAVISFLQNFMSVNGQSAYGALSPDTTFSGLIIDLTSILMLADMVRSAVRIRKLTEGAGKAGDR